MRMAEGFMVYVQFLIVSGKFLRVGKPWSTREEALASEEARYAGARLVRGDPSVIPAWLYAHEFEGLEWWELTADGERAVSAA